MINMFRLNYLPQALAWIYEKGAAMALLAWYDGILIIYLAQKSNQEIFIFMTAEGMMLI
jgi:hypothetical protein